MTYGLLSDEVYAFRAYLRLAEQMAFKWDENDMWKDCGSDVRFLKILREE